MKGAQIVNISGIQMNGTFEFEKVQWHSTQNERKFDPATFE